MGLCATARVKGTSSAIDTGHCTACPPVLTCLKLFFVSTLRQDAEFCLSWNIVVLDALMFGLPS